MSKTLLTLGFLGAGLLSAWAGDDKEVEEAIHRFKKGMNNPSAPARATAVTELSSTKTEKTAAMLGNLLGADTEPVRKAAALGLGGFTDYKKIVTPMLLNGLNINAKEPKVMEAIFQGLGKLDDETALPTIHKYFEDKDKDVASAALLSAAEIRTVGSIGADHGADAQVREDQRLHQERAAGAAATGAPGVPGGGGSDPKQALAKACFPRRSRRCR
jgi:HEAT repeat protein